MPRHARSFEATIQTRFTHAGEAGNQLGHISMTGMLHKQERDSLRRDSLRQLGAYALVYLFHGSGFYTDANGLDRRVSAGDLLLLFPDLGHAYGPTQNTAWSEFYLVFNGPVFDLWQQHGLLDPAKPVLHLQPVDHWLRQFESVLGTPRQVGTVPPLLEISRLQQVLAEALLNQPAGPRSVQDRQWAGRAAALIEARLNNELNLHEIADELDMSYETFRRRFRQLLGQPPSRYHAARLIDRACQLMQTSDMTDKQIADALGYCDEFYFSRRFKQITGQSPRRFRQSLPST